MATSDPEDGLDLEEEDAEPLFADDVDALDDPPPLPPPMPSLSQLQQSSQHHSTVRGWEGGASVQSALHKPY